MSDECELIPSPKHSHGSALHQEMVQLARLQRDTEAIRRGWDLHYEELERYPTGSVIRCCCGELIRFAWGDYGNYWTKLSWWRRWRKRSELAEAGL